VRELAAAERSSILCLQENKLHVISDFDVIQLLCAGFDYTYLPSIQTCGVILVAWKASSWSVTNSFTKWFSVTIKIRRSAGGPNWWFTSVYGPVVDT
jgi:hypothetical protein